MTTFLATHGGAITGSLPSAALGSGPGLAGRAGLVVLLLAAASMAYQVVSRRAARFRIVDPAFWGNQTTLEHRGTDTGTLTGADLGSTLGARATFVQFSAETCATCPQVSRILTSLTETEPGVVHVDLRSEDHLDLVRRFSVFRTPTVLLLDADGTVQSRTSGPLTPSRALTALSQLTQPTARRTHV